MNYELKQRHTCTSLHPGWAAAIGFSKQVYIKDANNDSVK